MRWLLRFRLHVPRRSYLEEILAHRWQWRKEGIVNEQPFRQLSKRLLDFGKWFYFVVGVLQLAFMTTFYTIYTQDWTQCPSGRCDLNATDPRRSEETGNPSWLWLVWPSVVLIYNGYMYFRSMATQLYNVLPVILRAKLSHDHRRRSLKSGAFTRCLMATTERLPPCAFPVAIFIWFLSLIHI